MANDTGVTLNSNGGYWQAVYIDSQGKRVRKSLGSKAKLSERAAKRKCQALAVEHAIQPAKRDAHRAPTLKAWTERYLELRRHELGDRTILEHEKTIAYLLDKLDPEATIDQISRADAADFRAHLAGTGMAEATIRKHIRNCKVIFRNAVELDMLSINPFDRQAGSTPAGDAAWHYVTDAELAALLEACPGKGWQSLIALCRLAGLRLGEALRLTWQHVDWQARTLTVEHKGKQTTKKRRRVVPIQPRLMEILLDRFGEAEPGETVTGVGVHNLTRNMQVIVQRAQLDAWDKLFHTLRKNLESDWLAVYPILDVCRWLGHDPSVAAKHYHQVKSETMDVVTGRAAEQEATEIDRLREELARQRDRTRRTIAAARKARRA